MDGPRLAEWVCYRSSGDFQFRSRSSGSTFPSLRDLFKDLLERAGVSDNIIEFLMGHRLHGLRNFYGKGHRSPPKIQQAINSLPPLPTATELKKNVLGRVLPSAK